MLRFSTRTFILYLLISLAIGVGVSQIVISRQLNRMDSELADQELQIAALNGQFESRLVGLQSEIDSKNIDFADLQIERNTIVAELRLLQTENAKLVDESQNIPQVSNGLTHNANTNGVNKEVAVGDEQLFELASNNTKLTENLLSLQYDNDAMTSALEQAQYFNDTLTQLINETQAEVDELKIQLVQLSGPQTPSPDNALSPTEVWGQPEFKSLEWSGRDFELQKKVEEIGRTYYKTHTYILDETDCNDMAVDLWNMLLTQNIKSVIVVGNLDKTGETFEELAHAWLYVFDSQGKVIYLEATTGEVMYGRLLDGSTNTRVLPYREGFIYRQPSTLWKDLKKIW